MTTGAPDLPNDAISVLRRFVQAVLDRPVVDVVALLTILGLMLSGPDADFVQIPVTLLGIAAILHPPWRTQAAYWAAIAGLILLYDVIEWNGADNHKWLMGWWCVALSMVHRVPEVARREVLASNGRWLLALVFTFATLWKVFSFDYLDHSFFEAELLTDSRFAAIAELAGGIDETALRENRRAMKLATASLSNESEKLPLVTSERIPWLAFCLTWWLVLMEGALALVLLWPGRSDRTLMTRSIFVLLFAGTTYSFVPVRGFGWMVIAMGYAQTPDAFRKVRGAYLGLVAIMYLVRLGLSTSIGSASQQLFGETFPVF